MTRSVGKEAMFERDEGFTLVEMLVSLLVLAIVLTALVPAFVGSMRATTTSNSRSTANGLAVAATEQIRAIPYYEIGYTSSAAEPSLCKTPPSGVTAGTPVVVDSGSSAPISPTSTQTIGNISYTTVRCLYWDNSSVSSDTNAFKQSVVIVTWKANGVQGQMIQTSAVYPGGQSTYASGGQQNFTPPAAVTPSTVAGPPLPPATVSAVDDPNPNSSWNTIDVSWTAPTNSATPAVNYIVQFTPYPASTLNPCPQPLPTNPAPTSTIPEPASASPLAVTVSPSTTYCFQVVSVAGDGTRSVAPSPVAYASSTSQPGCHITNLVVNNSNNTVMVDKNGYLVDSNNNPVNGIALQVSATNDCSNVSVGYTTNSSTILQAPVTGAYPTLSGTAGSSSTVWTTGNHTFTVYITDGSGLHSYNNNAVQQLVYICQEKGTSGKC